MAEQADRTQAINDYLMSQQMALFQQLESIKSFGCTSDGLILAVQQELEEIAGEDKWM